MKTNSVVYIEKKEEIALITIDNPPVNTLSANVIDHLSQLMIDIEKDVEVRVVIITGHGEKAFVAGANRNGFFDIII